LLLASMSAMIDHAGLDGHGLLDMDEHDDQEDLLQHVRFSPYPTCLCMYKLRGCDIIESLIWGGRSRSCWMSRMPSDVCAYRLSCSLSRTGLCAQVGVGCSEAGFFCDRSLLILFEAAPPERCAILCTPLTLRNNSAGGDDRRGDG
jgi:hypothetical protein